MSVGPIQGVSTAAGATSGAGNSIAEYAPKPITNGAVIPTATGDPPQVAPDVGLANPGVVETEVDPKVGVIRKLVDPTTEVVITQNPSEQVLQVEQSISQFIQEHKVEDGPRFFDVTS